MSNEFESLETKMIAAGYAPKAITRIVLNASKDREDKFDALKPEEKGEAIAKMKAALDEVAEGGEVKALDSKAIFAKFNRAK